jgi:hypothetical protein
MSKKDLKVDKEIVSNWKDKVQKLKKEINLDDDLFE